MWFLFTIRIQARIEQYVIRAEEYEYAIDQLRNLPKLKPFSNEWGSRVWIVSCYKTEDQPVEI